MPADQGIEADLTEAFDAEARRGVQIAIVGRAAAFILLWISYAIDALGVLTNPWFEYRSALIATALAAGGAHLMIARRTARPVRWAFPFLALDLLIVGALLFGWLPPVIADYPQFVAVRLQDVLILAVVLSLTVLPLSQGLAVFGGVAAALVWGVGVLVSFLRTPGAVTTAEAGGGLDAISQPLVLNTGDLAFQIVLLLAFASLLGLAIRQGRRLVGAAVQADRDVSALARFFPPAVAERLSAQGGRLASATRPVAVLFADFDRQAPGASALPALTRFYAACERAVFEHGGVVDRFAGDPVMATFGALDDAGETSPAERAWRCARALRAAQAEHPFGLAGVGLNAGEAVCGEVGSARQRAFGVVGETVNTARRMLDVARDRGVAVAMTASAAQGLPAAEAAGLVALEPVRVKGLADPVAVWASAP